MTVALRHVASFLWGQGLGLSLFLLALVTRPLVAEHPWLTQPVIEWLALGTLVVSAVIAAFFNRRRVCALLAMAAASYWLIRTSLQTPLAEPTTFSIYLLGAIATITGGGLAFGQPERGLRTIPALAGLFASFAPVLLVAWLAANPAIFEKVRLLEYSPTRFAASAWLLPTGITVAAAIPAVIAAYQWFRRRTHESALAATAWLSMVAVWGMFDRDSISLVVYSALGIASIVMISRSAYELAYRDQLTGLKGRRAMDEHLQALGRHYAIAMIDIDHFKRFNDTHGHEIGDEVLKMVALEIDQVGGGGSAYRYGGEEFSVLFPGHDRKSAKPYLEALRSAVEAHSMTVRNQAARPPSAREGESRRGRRRHKRGSENSVAVTISVGVADRTRKNDTATAVLKAADQALYRAKRAGRNRVS